jgi:FkbM family methyltransferase
VGWRRLVARASSRLLPGLPLPIRVAPGLWWLARGDAVSNLLFQGTFEPAERALLPQLVRPGMTVVDIGANAGIYTMLAARLVGSAGRVIAFEPSERERARLMTHLALNHISNVRVEPFAVGNQDGETAFFVAPNFEAGFNGRFSAPGIPMTRQRVPLRRLDTYADASGLDRVDFVKLDVEGGERDVLLGAERLLRRARATILCEIEPSRIEPWGYAPRDIYDLLAAWGYEWFAVTPGTLAPLPSAPATFNGNYLARPRGV